MATKTKTKTKPTKTTGVAVRDEDRSPVAAGPATLVASAADPDAEPSTFDPGGDIQTPRDEVVGKEIVITRWALAPAAEQYQNANQYGMFAVLGFRFASDPERKSRFLSIGAARIVESVHAALVAGDTPLPIRTTITSFTTRGGTTGYRFLRPGEKVR